MMLFIIKTLGSLLTFILMVLGNHQKENSKVYDPPCFFNPLCICSKAYPDLGRVTCKNTPLLNIPRQINASKVFTLHLENNGLRNIEPYFFSHTGLFKIEISRNFLTEISEETFSGLERSLWELNLRSNRFRKVPNQSFRYMQKLKTLDLSDNEITNVGVEDWLGLEDTLKTLILNGNKLSVLNPKAFSNLDQLENLDLGGNSISEFDASTFKEGPKLLNYLNLAGNLFSKIPFQELSELRELQHLDLSFNLITEIQNLNIDQTKKQPISIYINTLRLDYNQIQYLPTKHFKNFPVLKKTYLNGNPITYIEEGAFQHTEIQELFLKDCEISELTVDAFSGLEDHLKILDLEGNNLTTLPLYFFKEFDFLRALNLKDNFFKEIDSEKMFDGFQPTLQHLDLSGEQNSIVNFENFKKLYNLRSLSVSKLSQTFLSAEYFPEFFKELDRIKISFGRIEKIKSHAFKNIRGLKRLDLSENSIAAIENEAFAEVGHSLVYLSLANGLSSSWNELPSTLFKNFISLEFLDLSNNGLKFLSPQIFYAMKRLKVIHIQDNLIEFIPKKLFQGDIHSELSTIQFSFNKLSSIESQSFIGLNKLEYLWLCDNKIITIEKRAFMDLDRLKYLNFRGNKISIIQEESFQDLPELKELDLAYNNLKTFNYEWMEQIGTLSSFTLNISHNNIEQLITNLSGPLYSGLAVMNVNIKEIDFSHNNISHVAPRFFKPIESSVTQLYLSHNKIRNLTKSVFGNMIHLQWLDVSFNYITDLESDTFANTKNIQVLNLSNNQLNGILVHLLNGFHQLRILNLGGNGLRFLPDELFKDGVIEQLIASNNRLTKVPINAFDMNSAAFLSELDLSKNDIVTLPTANNFILFKNLYKLDLSKNRIIRVEDGIFSYLSRLRVLDLSHNIDLTIDSKGQTFYGLEDTLEDLIVKNLSLKTIPAKNLGNLKSLDLSHNQISDIPFEFSHNLPNLRKIELSGNNIVTIPLSINSFTELQYLGVSSNPLKSVNFQQNLSLRDIDLRNISISIIEKGAFGKLPLLESLKLSLYRNISDISIPHLLKYNEAIKYLYIEILDFEELREDIMSGSFSPKLQNLTLVGLGLKAIPRNLLQGIQSPNLHLQLFNTSVDIIEKDVFENVKKIRNLTLNLKSNNLKTMHNPNTGKTPNSSKKIFVTDLQISNNDWFCDCSIGWIESWEKKRRLYLCEKDLETCFPMSDDFRDSFCSNRKAVNVFEIFKTELECGWNSANSYESTVYLKLLIAVTIIWFLNF